MDTDSEYGNEIQRRTVEELPKFRKFGLKRGVRRVVGLAKKFWGTLGLFHFL